MALFNGVKRIEGSRSNTHLVKSGHGSPAGDWILDPIFKDQSMSSVFADGKLFDYQYGGPGMEMVTIPKGRLVSVGAPVKDFVDQTYKNVLTLPGLVSNKNIAGVAPYNFTKDLLQEDRLGGNKVSIITQDYITVPYMPGVQPATTYDKAGLLDEETRISIQGKMPWGALIGLVESGDYVKATPSGRFTKWVRGTDGTDLIVGKVLELDLNQEAWGWLKWVLWDESAREEDDVVMNRSGASNLPTDKGYPFDPRYADGLHMFQEYQTEFVTNPTGIPGLHDGSGNYQGFGRNDTEYTNIALGTVPAGVADNTLIVLQAVNAQGMKMKNLQNGVVVKIDGTAVDAANLAVNHETGAITVKVMAANAGKAITGTFKVKHYGTPSYLDFKGVLGSASILLSL